MTNNECKECGKAIAGRVDKVFCCAECRNAYNNTRYRSERSVVRQINKILEQNRKILIKLTPEGKRKIKRDDLIREGFDFKFFTHQYITGKGNIYHYCYEYGYIQLDEENMLLVKDSRKGG